VLKSQKEILEFTFRFRLVADSLLAGKALRIEGGNYELSTSDVGSGTAEETGSHKGTTKIETKSV